MCHICAGIHSNLPRTHCSLQTWPPWTAVNTLTYSDLKFFIQAWRLPDQFGKHVMSKLSVLFRFLTVMCKLFQALMSLYLKTSVIILCASPVHSFVVVSMLVSWKYIILNGKPEWAHQPSLPSCHIKALLHLPAYLFSILASFGRNPAVL